MSAEDVDREARRLEVDQRIAVVRMHLPEGVPISWGAFTGKFWHAHEVDAFIAEPWRAFPEYRAQRLVEAERQLAAVRALMVERLPNLSFEARGRLRAIREVLDVDG